jgi:hypothetical protein
MDYISSILIYYPGEIEFEIFSEKLSTGFELIRNLLSEILIVMLLLFTKDYETVLIIGLNSRLAVPYFKSNQRYCSSPFSFAQKCTSTFSELIFIWSLFKQDIVLVCIMN